MLVYNNLVESDDCDEEYIPIEPETVSEVNNGGDDMVLNNSATDTWNSDKHLYMSCSPNAL